MVTMILTILCVVASIMIHFEDKHRRNGEVKLPVWTNLVFKIWSGSTTVLLAAVFILEDGAWLIDRFKDLGAANLNACICAALATVWLAVVYGLITYLLIIPDDDEDMNIIADAIYYDGERR
ncbi:hypothetical protein IJJ18_03380 [Candidatus Saccharibacteria bacterium]|nr:hypothetical protein [Candidatus Saccharibacteria bacterium]